jgi:hypothetical protein
MSFEVHPELLSDRAEDGGEIVHARMSNAFAKAGFRRTRCATGCLKSRVSAMSFLSSVPISRQLCATY